MTDWKMRAADFYTLLDAQQCRCNLTGKMLTPENTSIAHKLPLKFGGKHELSNIQLVCEEISYLARSLPIDQIVNLALSIIATQITDNESQSADSYGPLVKSEWKEILRRITTLNKSVDKNRVNAYPKQRHQTWGKCFERALQDLRYQLR